MADFLPQPDPKIPSLLLKLDRNYKKTLLSCLIASEIVYSNNPIDELNEKFSHLNLEIKSLCASLDLEDYAKYSSLSEVKYLICDCSTNQKKKLIISFRGTQSIGDFFLDLKCNGLINDHEGRFHSGMASRSELIPMSYFTSKLKDGYQLVFTGHSLGAAIGALCAIKLLLKNATVKDVKKNVLFVGFGCPLFADKAFKEAFESNYRDNFHFIKNERDIVVELLNILSVLIYSKKINQDESDGSTKKNESDGSTFETYIQKCKEFVNFCHKFPIRKLDSISMLNNNLSLMLNITAKAFIPQYSKFGLCINLSKDDGLYLKATDYLNLKDYDGCKAWCQDLFKNPDDFTTKVQNHFIQNYFLNVYEKYYSWDLSFTVDKSYQHIASYLILEDLYVPKVKDEILHDIMLENIPAKYLYEVSFIRNDFNTDIFFTVYIHNLEYIVLSKLTIFEDCLWLKSLEYVKNEANEKGVCFRFSCPNHKLIMNQKKITLCLEIVGHFNKVKYLVKNWTLDIKEGLNHKRLMIQDMPIDLLYLYAAFYADTFKKLDNDESSLNGEFLSRKKKILDIFKQLSELWKLENVTHKYNSENKEELDSALSSCLGEDSLSNSDDTTGINVILKSIRSRSIRDTFVNLGKQVEENTAAELLPSLMPTIYEIKKQTASMCRIELNKNSSLLDTAWAFFSDYFSYLRFGFRKYYTLNKSYDLMYKNYVMQVAKEVSSYDEFKKLPPYVGLYERYLSQQIDMVKRKRSGENDLKLLDTVNLNSDLREILCKDYLIGTIGTKNAGKSTFVEMITGRHVETRGVDQVTKWIAPFSMCSNVVMFDYPHFNSTDTNDKLQFYFSRLLLDHVFVIFWARDKGETDSINLLPIIKRNGFDRYTIIFNGADDIWKKLKGDVEKMKKFKEEICTNLSITDVANKKKLILSCMDTSMLSLEESDLLASSDILKQAKIKSLVIDKIINSINKNDQNTKKELRDLMKRRQQERIQKIDIQITKGTWKDGQIERGKRSSTYTLYSDSSLKLNDDLEHNSIESLIEDVKHVFKLKDPLIKSNADNETIRSFDDFFSNEWQSYTAFENQ